jgi:hypothetical protein
MQEAGCRKRLTQEMRDKLCTAVATLVAVCPGSASATPRSGLPPLPARWPTTLQLGTADAPGDAPALRRSAPFGFRYQYLAGGANTGQGWSTWNPDGWRRTCCSPTT